ncbi:MAG: hypothetical protein HQK78_18745 [Desulfobacterales bacterium]|nr:hypothetical protein [Desulfobacterales bacterium]
MRKLLLLLIVFCFFYISAFGGDAEMPLINKRQKIQQHRIHEGVERGSLTKREAKNLRKGEQRLKNNVMKAKEDGKVTNEERKKVNKRRK